jgi:hypothetical protein
MLAAYSAMVRSLDNLPELATFRMADRAHSPGVGIKRTPLLVAQRFELIARHRVRQANASVNQQVPLIPTLRPFRRTGRDYTRIEY